ncbi:HNH endonuclease [Litchfieldia salsa]|uniref:HNH endonuclease n=1 Tax=Litchfieldia salsa TaxID=930152 RepID=A0A1H0PLK0_9BACI|nr:HNH endonuclease [Litchfieldia salsa]SDP05903.1 HNH endonuclease [Litchfieldia salsa]
MIELKSNVNADKLFKQLLVVVKTNGHQFDREYTIEEIGSLIPKSTSGIEKYESYNYSMTIMFSEQKGRDYFLFMNPDMKTIITDLANTRNRNNRAWNTIYGHERVRINPKYLTSNIVWPYQDVEEIRILPMSESDPEFDGYSIHDIQAWFSDVLPGTDFNFTKGMNVEAGTLVLFQYKAHIIASAILDKKVVFEEKSEDTYRGCYKFKANTIAIFQPLNREVMNSCWPSFKGFNQTQQRLDVFGYQRFSKILLEKELRFVLDIENEAAFQSGIENINITLPSVSDIPVDPVNLSTSSQSQRWTRNQVTAKRAILRSGYTCEYNPSHSSFKSKVTGQTYVEAHHLIPMEQQENFNKSLDVEANIVSLCPLCHKTVHHADTDEVEPIITSLFSKRQARLQTCEIELDLATLMSYYE